MYRHLLPLLLCQAVAPAPQAISDSDITYVQLQPPIDPPTAPTHYRESRIEHLPLTIPGNITLGRNHLLVDRNTTEKKESERKEASIIAPDVFTDNFEVISSEHTSLAKIIGYENAASPDSLDLTLPESSNLSERKTLPDSEKPLPDSYVSETALPARNAPRDFVETVAEILPSNNESESTDFAETLPETLSSSESIDLTQKTAVKETALTERADTLPENTDQILPEKTELTERDELLEAHGSELSDSIPFETHTSDRRGRIYESSETTDIFEDQTERYEDITQIPDIVVPRTKPTPKFIPKLSYFKKPQTFVSFPTNSLEKSAKRRFRSNCRCEKIWNCPKLQISVPRCPNEYFLCCF